MFAETPAIGFDQPPAMARFLRLHFHKDLGSGRVSFTKPLGEIRVDAAVFFLKLNRKGEDFLFVEIPETFLGHFRSLHEARAQNYSRETAEPPIRFRKERTVKRENCTAAAAAAAAVSATSAAPAVGEDAQLK